MRVHNLLLDIDMEPLWSTKVNACMTQTILLGNSTYVHIVTWHGAPCRYAPQLLLGAS